MSIYVVACDKFLFSLYLSLSQHATYSFCFFFKFQLVQNTASATYHQLMAPDSAQLDEPRTVLREHQVQQMTGDRAVFGDSGPDSAPQRERQVRQVSGRASDPIVQNVTQVERQVERVRVEVHQRWVHSLPQSQQFVQQINRGITPMVASSNTSPNSVTQGREVIGGEQVLQQIFRETSEREDQARASGQNEIGVERQMQQLYEEAPRQQAPMVQQHATVQAPHQQFYGVPQEVQVPQQRFYGLLQAQCPEIFTGVPVMQQFQHNQLQNVQTVEPIAYQYQMGGVPLAAPTPIQEVIDQQERDGAGEVEQPMVMRAPRARANPPNTHCSPYNW